jgi:Uma2 family endonuclease
VSTVGRLQHYRCSLDEYVRIEDMSPAVKHEYVDGEIIAMAGSTPEHAALSTAITIEIGVQLRGDCRTYSSDLRIWIAAAQLSTYPDVAVVCDPIARHPGAPTLVTNPKLVVEVLSPSSEAYDREDKRVAYQQLASLHAYVLVAQDRHHIELWQRTNGDWSYSSHETGTVRVQALELALDVDAIYRRAGL